MAKVNSNRYRISRARELESLGEILVRENVCQDTSPLYRAASQCRSGSGESWNYDMRRLTFRLSKMRHPIPCCAKEVTLELNVQIGGRCVSEEDDNARDPFEEYQLDIELTGACYEETERLVISSWHLDRVDAGNSICNGLTEFIHPYYHFQFGGRFMRESEEDFGASLILESPRIAHPPMDAVLGIDFVLTNYYDSAKLRFRDQGEYASIIRTAQHRIWRPYVSALSTKWSEASLEEQWPPSHIWPQLILE